MKAKTVNQIAKQYGYSSGFVRSACHRDASMHPLPHIEYGASRPIIYIRDEAFLTWLKEEELLTAGVNDNEAKQSLRDALREIREAWEELEEEIA